MALPFPPTASLSNGTLRRLIIALASQTNGNQVIGSLGQLGGFQLGSAASIAKQTGDISVVPDSGGAAGTYRVMFPNINANIQSISWFEVSGFTPRAPTATETCIAQVTGYNKDATTGQWYITVQMATLTTGAYLSTPPTGFVVGVRAAFVLTPQANAL
jgi:hypothetical protein